MYGRLLMKTIPAAQFKAKCLKLMDDVRRHREPLVITKNGVALAKLVPADDAPMGALGGGATTARIVGDITRPVIPARDWTSLRPPRRARRK